MLAGTVPETAGFGEVVAVAIPLRAIGDLPPGSFAGKLVVDANNYVPRRDGHLPELDADQPPPRRCWPPGCLAPGW